MMGRKKSSRGMKISTKMLVTFLLISLVPLVIVSMLSLNRASDSLETAAKNQLLSMMNMKKENIEQYFRERQADINILSQLTEVRQGILDFSEVVQENGYDSQAYQQVEAEYHRLFQDYIERYQYYDLFFIDMDGEIVYTVEKEADFGTNLVTGPYRDSGLGQAFHGAKDGYTIVDYDYYEPSNEPAAFIAIPVENNVGNQIGVVALQISDSAINEVMNDATGLGETGETYLVGADLLLRSDSRFIEDSLGVVEVDTVATRDVFSGHSDVQLIKDYRGQDVLSSYSSLEIEGLQWAVIAEIDEAEALAVVHSLQTLIIIITVVSIFIIIFISIFFSKSITKPIEVLKKELTALAENGGDLTQRIHVDSKDEIGQLADATNRFLKNVRGIMKKVLETSEHVASSSEQLNSSSDETSRATNQVATAIQEIAQGADVQVQSSEETADAMEAISKGIQRVAETSATIAESSNVMIEKARDGQNAIDSATKQMSRINESTDETTSVIQLLQTDSKEIGEIIQLITDISEQTNLLALNAAIEAARAGEAGKGFAVVADEIRKLADQTGSSATNIHDLINRMQGNTDEAVKAMSESKQDVDGGITLIDEVGTAFADILKQIEQVSLQIEDMTAVSEEMSASTEEVTASVEEVANTAKSSSSHSQQVAAASEEQLAAMEEVSMSASHLAERAEELKLLVNRFKV